MPEQVVGRIDFRGDQQEPHSASRNTVSARVDQLITAGLLEEGGRGWSTGGRPPTILRFNSRAGCVLAVDLGVTSVDVAVTDLSAEILASAGHPIDIAEGPRAVLAEVDRLAQQVLTEAGLTPGDVCAVGVGVPGPVEFSTGRPSHPPIMPGWHDFPIPSAFARYECPVYVDNDVNVMALGEMGIAGSLQDVLVVKVGTGIGCGIIVDGRVYRGAQGSAGDIGHIYVAQPDGRSVMCRCGQENCLEAIAGGGALLRYAVAAGLAVDTVRDVVQLAAQGDGAALELVRNAGGVWNFASRGKAAGARPAAVVRRRPSCQRTPPLSLWWRGAAGRDCARAGRRSAAPLDGRAHRFTGFGPSD